MNTTMMRAIVYTEYGSPDVLRLEEVEKPYPSPDEVLIQVRATTVTAGDVNLRGFSFVPDGLKLLTRLVFGLRRPRQAILGTEVAGEIVAVGKNVTRFKVGDAVFGIGSDRLGAYAEYVTRKAEEALALIPQGMTFEEAVSVPFGAMTAYYFLKDRANLQAGQHVLVNGASGGVGVYAVQIAKVLGAEVTAVCSTRNIAIARELGADHVIDYTCEDFTKNPALYDVIIDTVVGAMMFKQAKSALKSDGLYLAVAGGIGEMIRSVWNKRIIVGTPPETAELMNALVAMLKAGQIKPVIDRTYVLEETTEAHRYVETRRKRGSVVITLAPMDEA
jgi:NADPH:quinone reductase-like Zn-dependent oxidoreductase